MKVGQVYQHGRVPDTLTIERKYMKGGKPSKPKPKPADHVDGCKCKDCVQKPRNPTANGRTLPIAHETKPFILAWLRRMAELLKVKDIRDVDPMTPLFMSRVRNKDGSRRAISREQAWRIIKAIARENEFDGKIATHSTRKTLAVQAHRLFKDVRKVARVLGHKSLSSTEHYLESVDDQEIWLALLSSKSKAA